jgi:ATP-dependent protease ClpP protease subunit
VKNIDFNEKDRIATLFIMGYIGEDYYGDGSGSSDRDIITALKSLEGKIDDLYIPINCFGGSVKHAWGITNYLLNAPFNIHTSNEGLVCSAAFIIYLSAPVENRTYGKLSRWMAHSVVGGAYGNLFEIEDVLKVMKGFNSVCADFINSNTAAPVDWMNIRNDTWLEKDDMLKHGLIEEQEEFPIDDIKNTLFTSENMKQNKVLATKILNSYNSHKNNSNMNQKPDNAATPPAAAHAPAVDDDAFVQFERRLADLEQKHQTITQENQTLNDQIDDQAKIIADMQQKLDAKPAADPAQVNLDKPINQSDHDEFVDIFAQEGNELVII